MITFQINQILLFLPLTIVIFKSFEVLKKVLEITIVGSLLEIIIDGCYEFVESRNVYFKFEFSSFHSQIKFEHDK
jgi:hypothetical protein